MGLNTCLLQVGSRMFVFAVATKMPKASVSTFRPDEGSTQFSLYASLVKLTAFSEAIALPANRLYQSLICALDLGIASHYT